MINGHDRALAEVVAEEQALREVRREQQTVLDKVELLAPGWETVQARVRCQEALHWLREAERRVGGRMAKIQQHNYQDDE